MDRQDDVCVHLVAKQVVTVYINHTCALKVDTIQCWGRSTGEQNNIPVNLIAKKISAEFKHTCALKQDNTV